jgi:hypothetical protein
LVWVIGRPASCVVEERGAHAGGSATLIRDRPRDVAPRVAKPNPTRFTKSNLPSKACATCGRPFEWRKKWARDWANVKHCSKRCAGEKPRRPGQDRSAAR